MERLSLEIDKRDEETIKKGQSNRGGTEQRPDTKDEDAVLPLEIPALCVDPTTDSRSPRQKKTRTKPLANSRKKSNWPQARARRLSSVYKFKYKC